MKNQAYFSLICSVFLCGLIGICGCGSSGGGGGGSPFTADIYVSVKGSDETGTGSLETPYRTIQRGLNEAMTGEVVGVLAGVYTEEVSWPATFEGIVLRGVSSSTAILKGKGTGPCMTIDNLLPSTQMITIEDMMITEGDTTGDGGGIRFVDGNIVLLHLKNLKVHNNSAGNGGGLYTKYATDDVLIEGCTFSSNEAVGSVNMWGGGIYQSSNSDMIIIGSTFTCNEGKYGAAISTSSSGIVRVISSNISNNTSSQYGGGMVFYSTAAFPLVKDCTIKENYAASKGGGIFTQGCSITVEGCLIEDNTAATNNGGGVYMDSTAGNKAFFVRDMFKLNSASAANGSGVFTSISARFERCLFAENYSPSSNGAGIGLNINATGEVINCIFQDNEGYNGGAVRYDHGTNTLKIINSTFVRNKGVKGSSVYMTNGDGVEMVNSIFHDGQNGVGTEELYSETNNFSTKYCNYPYDHANNDSTVYHIVTAPTFVRYIPYDYDLHLSDGCYFRIQREGTFEGAPSDDYDSDGVVRPGADGGYSMGAYEYK